jgi:hypothetical protein
VAAWPKGAWLIEAEEFANVLALIELAAATAIFRRQGWTNIAATDVTTLSRHKAQAAIQPARIDHAEAERLVVPHSAGFDERPAAALNVIQEMANAGLKRARRVLEPIDDG